VHTILRAKILIETTKLDYISQVLGLQHVLFGQSFAQNTLITRHEQIHSELNRIVKITIIRHSAKT